MQSSASGSDKVTPFYEIPYIASSNFVGRIDELARLHEILQSSEGVVISAVAGMGGVGKTQLAVQYATRHKADYPGGIYWLNGRTGDLATQILLKAEFDRQLEGLAAAKEQYNDLGDLVQWCWRHWTPDETTLVVLDDITEWAKCRAYCSKEARFRVLVTTRRKDVLPNFPRIDLEMLQPEEARSLLASLEGHGRVDQQPELADKLCEGLGYLPLVIELVGCYLARDRHITLSQVWERLQANGMQDPALERSQEDEITAERGVKAAFVLTWETMNAEAQEVARLLGYFALDWIEWDVAEWVMQRVKGEAYALGELKARLENASLVQIEKDAPWVCRLHPLIRQFLQEQEAEAAKTAGEAPLRSAFVSGMIAIASQLPDNPPTKDVEWFSRVRSHVQEVAERHTEGLEGNDLTWTFIGLARFYEGQALFAEGEYWSIDCLRVTQGLYEGDHRDVALSLHNLASLYYSQGKLTQAEPLYLQALAMRQRLYEGDHRDVAFSLKNLAGLYYSQGKLTQAESLYLQALAMRQRLYKGDHQDMARSLHNLAVLYNSQGKLTQAEPLYLQALAMTQRLFESNHSDVASNLNDLAVFYHSQGKLTEAEPLYAQALAMYQRLFEGDHPDVATSLNNLAGLYYSQDKLTQVEPLYLQALAMRRRLYEGDHPDVASNLNNLAVLYKSQGKLTEAEPLYAQALAMYQRLYKGDHPDVTRSLNNLAGLYDSQDKLTEAEPLYAQALAMYQRLYEGDHPNVATSLNNLAYLYYCQERFQEAEPLLMQALEMQRRILGDQHSQTLSTLNSLQNLRQHMQMSDRHVRSTDHPLRSSDRHPPRRSFLHRLSQQIKQFIRRLMRYFS